MALKHISKKMQALTIILSCLQLCYHSRGAKKNDTQGTERVFVSRGWIARPYMVIIGDVKAMQRIFAN